MDFQQIPSLRQWRGAPRALALGFCLTAAAGLAVSLLMVHFDSGLGAAGMATRFAGPETGEVYPHTFASLLQTTHTHLYTLAFLEILLGGLFLAASAPSKLKTAVIAAAWAGMALDHAGMWLAFSLGSSWVWLLALGGSVMGAALALQMAWCAWDLALPFKRQGA